MPDVHVSLRKETPQEEVERLREALRAEGVDVRVEADLAYLDLSAGAPVQVVEVFVEHALPWLALAYATGIAGTAGRDTWEAYRDGGWRGLSAFLRSIGDRPASAHPQIKIQTSTAPELEVSEELPDEAVRQLADLDWSQLVGGRMAWHEGQWVWLPPGGRLIPAPVRQSDEET